VTTCASDRKPCGRPISTLRRRIFGRMPGPEARQALKMKDECLPRLQRLAASQRLPGLVLARL